jgi:hypothetical protein
MNIETRHLYDPNLQFLFSKELNKTLFPKGTGITVIVVSSLAAILPQVVVGIGYGVMGQSPGLLPIAVAGGVGFFLYLQICNRLNRYFASRLSSVESLAGAEVVQRLDDQGLHGEMRHNRWSVDWAGIDRVVSTESGVMFVVSLGAYFVPASAFSDRHAMIEFVGKVIERLSPDARERSKVLVA